MSRDGIVMPLAKPPNETTSTSSTAPGSATAMRKLTERCHNQRRNDAEQRSAEKRAAPPDHSFHEQQGSGGDGAADHPGAGVERERLDHALRRDPFGKERVVGWMIDRVGEPQQR